MTNESKGLNTANLKNELRMVENFLDIDKSNSELLTRSVENKTEREIRVRISYGLYKEEEKNLLAVTYDELHGIISAYFKENNTPSCPFSVYSHVLKRIGIKPTSFFSLVVRNDGALIRWADKTDEWAGYDRFRYLDRQRILKTMIGNLENPKAKEEPKFENVFDGQAPLDIRNK